MTRPALCACTLAVAAAFTLQGCGEAVQTAGSKPKADAKAWQGPAKADSAFVASGFKPGDQTAWQEQLRTRAQSQNEYQRVPAPANATPAPTPK